MLCIYGIRKKHKPNNRESTRKNLERNKTILTREWKLLSKIDLKVLFEGYCKNFPIVYGGKYQWTGTENLTWLTHGILRFFRGLGESMGFNIAFDTKNIGSVSLKSKGDLFWVKDKEPVLHLECENAYEWSDIREELENLGSSGIPYKIGIFQFVESALKSSTIGRVIKFLRRKKFLENGIKWLLIFDMWYETTVEKVKYEYKDPKTSKAIIKNFELEWYPLYGIVLGERTNKKTLAKVFRLPFNKIGVVKEKDWTKMV